MASSGRPSSQVQAASTTNPADSTPMLQPSRGASSVSVKPNRPLVTLRTSAPTVPSCTSAPTAEASGSPAPTSRTIHRTHPLRGNWLGSADTLTAVLAVVAGSG